MRRLSHDNCTDPPLNAPTGLFTAGAAIASCNCDLVVWNDLDKKGDGVLVGRAEDASRETNTREAMVVEEGEKVWIPRYATREALRWSQLE